MALHLTAKPGVVLAVLCCAVGLRAQDRNLTGSVDSSGRQGTPVRCPPDIRYYHHDATGNLWAVSDESASVVWRAEVWPFGQGIPTSPDTAQRFLDEPRVSDIALAEDLYHLGARTHDPLTGRFLTTDPQSLTKVPPENPQQFNRFSYGLNNPLRFSDRSGASPVDRRNGERSSSRDQGKEEEDPIEARKVTKAPIIIFDEEGNTPYSLIFNPKEARKAILKEKKEEAPTPKEAKKAVEDARMQILFRKLGPGPLTKEIVDEAKRRSGDVKTLKRPTLTRPPRSPLTICNCPLQPTPSKEDRK
ncbi:MAG: RHS repeat-associated core domain-containing protein [Phycisphaerae bacterium]|jgi:RHS repeat-associated protein